MSEKEPINNSEQDLDDSSATETSSESEILMKELNGEARVSNIEDSDGDEESSDHEGEKEQYISLPLYMQTSKDAQKKLKAYQLKDPLEEKESKTEVTAPIKELTNHCSNSCDNGKELNNHMHKDEAALHVCPHCPFKSRQLIEWINHKVVCAKENPVSAVASESVGKQSTSNPQKVVLNSLENQEEEQPPIKPAESEQSTEENMEVRKPLIKVKPEFSIKTFEKNLENNKKRAEALVINCYQPKSGFIKLDNVNPFIRKKCNVTVKKIIKMNNTFNEPVVRKEKKILPKKPNQDVKEYDILNEDILETIKTILSKHASTDHNYNRIDFLQRLGISDRRWNDTEIMQLIVRLRKLASRPLILMDVAPQEEIVAYNLMHELEYLLQLRTRRKIEMSHIKAKAGMLGGATKRTINSKLRIENFLNIKLECPDDSLELPLQDTVQSTNNLKRPLPIQEKNVNIKRPFVTSILKRPLPNQENNDKEPLHKRINIKIPVNHENNINITVKKPVHQRNIKKPVNLENNVNNTIKKPVNHEINVNEPVKKSVYQGNNVKKLVNLENNVNNAIKKPVNHENNVNEPVKKSVYQGNNVKKLVNLENNVNNTVKKPGNIIKKPVHQENKIQKSIHQKNNANNNFKKPVKSNSKLEVDKSEILHTCKKSNKRKARHRYVGKIGYWSRVKGGVKKRNCAACLKNSKCEPDG